MVDSHTDIYSEVASYYSKKIAQYGDTAQGVDWNSEASQELRFKQLCKIFDAADAEFSLNDLGCGYGGFLDFLAKERARFSYLGVDISEDMIRAAQRRNLWRKNSRFIVAGEPDQVSDYGVASGVFNVRLGRSNHVWHDYIRSILDTLNQTSRLGFAFNCLTSYSDENKKQAYLHYADPCQLFDMCKQRYSKQVALLHDYGLYEFTILVRK